MYQQNFSQHNLAPGHAGGGHPPAPQYGTQKRLPNPVIVANEAIGYVSMCNDTRWRSYGQDELMNRVKESRQKFIGKEFLIGFSSQHLQGKRIHVSGMDQAKFHCELLSSSSGSDNNSASSSGSNVEKITFSPAPRVGIPFDRSPVQDAKYNIPSPSLEDYYKETGDARSSGSTTSSAGNEGNKSRSPKRLSMAQRQMAVLSERDKSGTNSTTACTGNDSSELEMATELVKLNISNLVPIGSLAAQHEAHALSRSGPWSNQWDSNHSNGQQSRSWNGNLTFERIERKVQQAIFFFKGQPPVGAKDQTIFNRELFQSLNARYRTDELHRLDILEILLKAKKVSFLNIQCKELCLWEDDERNLKLDKVNIETNTKRLRIKNMDAARHKHKMKEQNVMYGLALHAVRPACIGNGSVNFAQFDYGLPRDAKFENQLYTRFVKFVKYGMCERCQHYYLERGSSSSAAAAARAAAQQQVGVSQGSGMGVGGVSGGQGTTLFGGMHQQRPPMFSGGPGGGHVGGAAAGQMSFSTRD
eukprot:CAMPEP_0178999894 /NCGR_PEP_ID=MMETSP0795-20121207/10353_1 /TAXON_ID=88552 /ORGANISM="Amoebophrya sp., Strain Ameob2" /LENGTH=528 /DNA_ID=CAMNT_0020692797 /DNA_START=190 /DNA_END=1776 /DNA_ORIENTATION=+